MIIDDKKVVTLNYKLQKDNADGELVEETFGKQPLVFIYGIGQMLPHFEENISGKKEGDSLSFGIKAENGYGLREPKAVVAVPKSTFVVEGVLQEELLKIGNFIPLQDQNGHPLNGQVLEIKEDNVILDFNHPMAGTDLFFSVQVESIRAATAEELDHGHVHGPGGHQH